MRYANRFRTRYATCLVREAAGPEYPHRAGQASRPHALERPLLFAPGRLVATPGALAAFRDAAADPVHCLARHLSGDWGDVGAEDRAANDRALREGERLLSAYVLATGARVWILTEADRSATTILLSEEY